MKVRVSIDKGRCTKCLECVKYCPTSVFTVKDNDIVVKEELCIYCKGCEVLCPTKAIRLECLDEGLEIIKVKALTT